MARRYVCDFCGIGENIGTLYFGYRKKNQIGSPRFRTLAIRCCDGCYVKVFREVWEYLLHLTEEGLEEVSFHEYRRARG